MSPKYWLMKSEPDVYSIDRLKTDKKALWDGVRNYQARNFMRDSMQLGDLVLFYHSNAEPPGVAGVAKVSGPARPDPTQWEKSSSGYDPKSPLDQPRWFCVELAFVGKFERLVPLNELKTDAKLSGLMVIRKGMRLSIQPVEKKHFDWICQLGGFKSVSC